MEEKILSIIVPTYNMEDYISKCLDSLIVPSIDKLDILVINDGSKDMTSEIAHEYEKKYPESIRVIDKKNGNYGSCINVGLPLAIGKYVKILDADDTYNTPELENFIKTLSEVEVDLVLSEYVRVNKDGQVIAKIQYSIRPNQELKFNEILGIAKDGFSMHAVCYKRSIFDGLNYHQTEGISYTDMEWIFLPMSNVNTVLYHNKIIKRYLIGREGQTMNEAIRIKRSSHLIQLIKSMLKSYDLVSDICPLENRFYLHIVLKNVVIALYFRILIQYYGEIDMGYLIELEHILLDYNHSLYNEINEITASRYIPFHYIQYWRKHYLSRRSFYKIPYVLLKTALKIKTKYMIKNQAP